MKQHRSSRSVRWLAQAIVFVAVAGAGAFDVHLSVAGSPTEPPKLAFVSAAASSSGNHSHGIAAADLGDSPAIDLAVANAYDGTVSVFLGRGDGTFASLPDRILPVGDEPKSVMAADLDGDGAADLVTANQGSADVTVMLAADGLGAAVAYPACDGAHETAVADLDADGDQDVVVACWGAPVLAILENDGGGRFTALSGPTAGAAAHSVVAADLDGDGDVDLAVAARAGDAVTIARNDGGMTFTPLPGVPVGTTPHSVRAADLDGDGDQDLVVANDGSDSISVLSGDGTGRFDRTDVATGRQPKSVAIADIDGDGALDVITADAGGNYPDPIDPGGTTLSVLLGAGDGTLRQPVSVPSPGTPFAVIATDLDGDGRIDLASANWNSGTASVLLRVP